MTAKIVLMFAAGPDGLIGRDGKIPWTADEAPGDLARFRELTMGHMVIMGRKTAESLPMGCLPGRINIILTRDKTWKPKPRLPRSAGAQIPPMKVVHSVDEALAIAQNQHEVYVIGGAEIIDQFWGYADEARVTIVGNGGYRNFAAYGDGIDEPEREDGCAYVDLVDIFSGSVVWSDRVGDTHKYYDIVYTY